MNVKKVQCTCVSLQISKSSVKGMFDFLKKKPKILTSKEEIQPWSSKLCEIHPDMDNKTDSYYSFSACSQNLNYKDQQQSLYSSCKMNESIFF